jgi:hypothetical protein
MFCRKNQLKIEVGIRVLGTNEENQSSSSEEFSFMHHGAAHNKETGPPTTGCSFKCELYFSMLIRKVLSRTPYTLKMLPLHKIRMLSMYRAKLTAMAICMVQCPMTYIVCNYYFQSSCVIYNWFSSIVSFL